MAVYKDPKPTKNGRAWYFKFSYKNAFGATKQYRSKRYLTKKDASDAERMFLVTSTDKVEDNNMTFKDLYDDFRMHNDEIMKDTTKYGYDNNEKFIECFFTVKLKDFNIMQFMFSRFSDIPLSPISSYVKPKSSDHPYWLKPQVLIFD